MAHPVLGSVDHDRGHGEPAECLGPVAGGAYGAVLTTAALARAGIALERERVDATKLVEVLFEAGGTDRLEDPYASCDRVLLGPGPAAERVAVDAPGRPALAATTGRRQSEANERTRAGCRIAIVWAIIPPSEAPTTCADRTPRASRRPTASSAMSSIV
jgi:hypothetical protein